jgi:ABC-type sugar transport system permease subunit
VTYYKKWITVSICMAILLVGGILLVNRTAEMGSLDSYTNLSMDEQIQSLVYDETSGRLYAGSYQNRITALDSDGTLLWSFPTGNVVTDLVLGSDGVLYAASDDQHVYRIDARSGELLQAIDIRQRVFDIAVDEEHGLIAVSAGINEAKHYVMLYTLAGEKLWSINTHSTARAIAFSDDAQQLYAGTNRADLIRYSVDGEELGRTRLRAAVKGIAVQTGGDAVAVATEYGSLYLLDTHGEITFSRMYELHDNIIGFGADDTLDRIALGGRLGELYILDDRGEVLFSDDRKAGISAFDFTDTQLAVGSLGEPVRLIPLDTFTISRFIGRAGGVLKLLIAVLACGLTVSLLRSFQRSRDVVKNGTVLLIKHRTAYLLLLPTFIMLIIFMYYPMIIAFVRAFTDWNIRSEEIHFIGFANFRRMVTEGYFLLGLKNLFTIAVADMLKVLTVPLIVAELVFALRSAKARYWFRFMFVLPMVVPMIVTVLMWKNIYDPSIGLLNQLLETMDLEHLQRVWLGDPKTALGAVIAMNFPFIDGFAFLVFYGGLINIPTQLFEAAKVDGAGRFWNLTRIHLPLLTPQIKLLIILKFIGSIQNFMPIYILTGGGPGVKTYVPGLELYYHATTFGNYGYACALGMAMFVFILIGTFFNMRMRTQSQS